MSIWQSWPKRKTSFACKPRWPSWKLKSFIIQQTGELTDALEMEERRERERDRKYWEPLMAELQALRHARLKKPDF
jgi:hypothetical protein